MAERWTPVGLRGLEDATLALHTQVMTTTTATAKLRFIPQDGKPVTVVVNGTAISAKWTNGAGWTVMARRDGYTIHANTQPVERIAVDLFNQLVEQHGATDGEQPAPVEPVTAAEPVKLPAAAKGSQTKVSDPQHVALAVAALNGRVNRGGQPGEFNVRVLTALARRGYLRLTYQEGRSDSRQIVTGGTLTNPGRIRLDQLTADERAEAEKAARLAVIDSIRIAA
jgi:hypothetical protein